MIKRIKEVKKSYDRTTKKRIRTIQNEINEEEIGTTRRKD